MWTAVALGAGAAASPAQAGFGIAPGSFTTTPSSSEAGAHADLTTSFDLNRDAEGEPIGTVKDIGVDMPPGVVGNPTATPRCPMSQVIHGTCPPDSAVGVATAELAGIEAPVVGLVYNIVPYADEPAAFAFAVVVPVRLDIGVRSNGDYGVHVSVRELTEAHPILSSTVTLWGVPEAHNGPGPFNFIDSNGIPHEYGGPGPNVRIPFLTNPEVCGASALHAVLAVRLLAGARLVPGSRILLPDLQRVQSAHV